MVVEREVKTISTTLYGTVESNLDGPASPQPIWLKRRWSQWRPKGNSQSVPGSLALAQKSPSIATWDHNACQQVQHFQRVNLRPPNPGPAGQHVRQRSKTLGPSQLSLESQITVV